MNESHDAATILGGEVEAGNYLRAADIRVENLINPADGHTLALTLAQFDLDDGDWKKSPSQGEEVRYGANPLKCEARNATYPGEVRGYMVFVVQTNAKLRLEFHSSLTSYGATINGAASAWVNGFLFTLETSIAPETGQPHFSVQAIQYRKS